MTKAFRDNCDISTVQQTNRDPLFPKVQIVLKCTFSFLLYANVCITIMVNFKKSCMQRLCVAYNFGSRALYNLPQRASVSSHQVQCNISTFEALVRKNMYLFRERCRKSTNVLLRAVMQSDCLYSSLFCEHYNRILLCDWVLGHCSVCSFEGVSCHNAFVLYLTPNSLGISVLLCSSVVPSVTG